MRISDWSSDVCSSDLAAGAVGSAAGQIANIHGCRTIGITSSATKQRLCIEQFGYEAAIDYRSEDVDVRLAELCPDGIDIYYDNTAGANSDAVMRHLPLRARVIDHGSGSCRERVCQYV